MKNALGVSLCLFTSTFASDDDHGHGHGHGAHEHGVVNLQLAVEKNELSVLLKGPAESFYGFEHEAKSPAEKKAKDAAMEVLRSGIQNLIIVNPKLGCRFKSEKLEIEEEDHKGDGQHQEVLGQWKAICERPLLGSEISFSFSKTFSRIEVLKVELLSDKKQNQKKFKHGDGKFTL